jgi:hypothetical protein
MRSVVLALVSSAVVIFTAVAPAAQAESAGWGVESFFAGNCSEKHETCNKVASPNPDPKIAKEEEVKKAEKEGFTQAGGHPNFGITDFTVKNTVVENKAEKKFMLVPNGVLRHIRVDVAPGVSTNPQAVPRCTIQDFGTEEGPGVFPAPNCPTSSIIGKNEVLVLLKAPPEPLDLPLEGKVYNLEQPGGLSSLFGVAIELPEFLTGGKKGIYVHTLIKGGVEYASDYHDFFEIEVSETLPLIKSRLTFEGNKGIGGFLTNGTSCTGIGPQTTTTVTLEDNASQTEAKGFESPIGGSGCNVVPFQPTFGLEPGTSTSDAPDGITTNLTLPHDPNPEKIDSSDVATATVELPEGMTINPAAANGLEGCTRKQFGIGTRGENKCPAGSRIGTVALEVPGLPAESLRGFVYQGEPENGSGEGIANSKPPYTIFIDAESAHFNIKSRLEGVVSPNLETGRLTTTVTDNPEQPFSELILHFNGGAFAPVANPLVCGASAARGVFAPYTGTSAVLLEPPFNTTGCSSSPPPFKPTQSTAALPNVGGSTTALAFTLTRPEGQQYLNKMTTTLPPGLYGKIPTVPVQCSEAQANGGTCPAGSMIGTVTVGTGSGTPFPLTGTVFLTGPDKGAPYGLEFEVPVIAGPFNLGVERTHATINVNPYTFQVEVSATLPTIRGGIPARIRSLTVNLNRANYILNPTNCGALSTASSITSTLGATANISSPFQVEGCSSLAYAPSFKATTSGKFSKGNGASLETTINTPEGGANMKSVLVQLPKQLPSRLTTLNKACPEKTFAANPLSCPAGSKVGSARANTSLLPGKMQGPAIFVSHGGEAFPDLDLVLEANGIRVIVTGNTKITKGITTTNFATTPDAPVSSVTVNLPLATNSALAANGNLCTENLVMPTTITAQNGKVFKQNTKIGTVNCPVQIVGHKVVGTTAYLTVQTYSAGRVSGSGNGLSTVAKHLNGATRTQLKVPLSSSGRSHLPKSVRVRVGFFPKKKGAATSTAFQVVRFN